MFRLTHRNYLAGSLMLISLAGCSSGGAQKKIVRTEGSAQVTISSAYLDTKALSDIDVAMTTLGYDGNQLANAANQASFNASMQPGANPQAGLAGALISMAIIQSSQKSAAQKSKNQPVDQFLHTLEGLNWAELIKTSKLGENYSFSAATAEPSKPHKTHKLKLADPRILIKPSLLVTGDYRSLLLTADVSVIEHGKVRYKNLFHIQSEPLLNPNNLLDSVNSTSAAEAGKIVQSLVDKLPMLIQEDRQNWPDKDTGKSTSIRFVNSTGEYFERGYFLEQKDGIILFKSLRGEIKLMPCQKLI